MRLIFTGLLLISACLLGGCAKYWYQDGRTFDQCRQEIASCQTEATRYSDVGRTYGLGRYERQFVEECMLKKGYQLLPEKDLPIRVKRESSLVFGLPGIAGTVD